MYKTIDALPGTLDAASTTGHGFGFRVKPQNKTLHIDIAAGVFSETWDYIGGAKIRPEIFSAPSWVTWFLEVRRPGAALVARGAR